MNYKLLSCLIGLFILTVFITSGCSGENQDQELIYTSNLPLIDVKLELTIEEQSDIYFDRVFDILSDSKGRIYVPDQRNNTIHIYDKNGDYINNIGQQGSGPGEFQSFLRPFIDEQNRLYTHDVRLNRSTVFSESGGEWSVEAIYSSDNVRDGIYSADQSGNVVISQAINQFADKGLFWVEHILSTGTIENGVDRHAVLSIKHSVYVTPEGSQGMRMLPYGRVDYVTTRTNGDIYLVWTDRFDLKIYDASLKLKNSLSLNLPQFSVPSEERNQLINRFADSYRAQGLTDPFIPVMREHIPDTKPVIYALHVTPGGNIILQTYDSPEYIVIAADGSPIGSFDLDESVRLSYADDNRLYGIYRDDEGVQLRIYEY